LNHGWSFISSTPWLPHPSLLLSSTTSSCIFITAS
jgi:hypothetical protein